MADRFCRRPKQNSNCDRGANRDRKPVPHAHQWFGFATADTNFAEFGKANPDTETQGEKRTEAEHPAKVIQNPVLGSVDDPGKSTLYFFAVRTDRVRRDEVQGHRSQQQQKRRPEHDVVERNG